MSFAHVFDAESITLVRNELGPMVAGRIARDKPTLCDLIRVAHLLGWDPRDLFR
ncbi:hypothetical protein [Nocardia sp. NPDC048505]|uniref:hypothetical protein n=1 Tax=unclassified Nocardia TaxID=2637762 RepID=UPI0033F6617E